MTFMQENKKILPFTSGLKVRQAVVPHPPTPISPHIPVRTITWIRHRKYKQQFLYSLNFLVYAYFNNILYKYEKHLMEPKLSLN